MELIFIRHGEGEHTLNLPASLHKRNPSLTINGMDQAKKLKDRFPLSTQDIVFISPLVRTMQTAILWADGLDCRKIVTPYVSPRMFSLSYQISRHCLAM